MRALQYDLPVIPVILLFCVGPVPGFVRFRQKSELKSGVGQVSSKSQCEIRQNLGFTSGSPRELNTKQIWEIRQWSELEISDSSTAHTVKFCTAVWTSVDQVN